MFVTMPQFEQFVPPNLVGANQKYWRAVTLSLELPWYLFIYYVTYEGQRVPQTTLVAWEASLLEMLTGIPPADRIAIGRFEKKPSQDGRWELTWIETIWEAAQSEIQQTGTLLLQLEGETQLRDAQLRTASMTGGRTLIYSANPRPEANPTSFSLSPVPDEFPQPTPAGAVAGAHPKVGVIQEDGLYVDNGWADRTERFHICNDIVSQLIGYIEKKRLQTPERPLEKLIYQVLAEMDKKRFGWGLSPAEGAWVARMVKAHYNDH